MAACWKALAAVPDIELYVYAFGNNNETDFDLSLTASLNITFVERDPDFKELNKQMHVINPEVIVLCGWFVPAYRKLGSQKSLRSSTRFILAMDTPWLGTIRQYLGILALRGFMKKMNAVITSGERSYQYAYRLGARSVTKIQYGVNVDNLQINLVERLKFTWPKRFLFVGRYAPEKGIHLLIDAYNAYRQKVTDPWELHTCGKGPLEGLLEGEGIINHGFVQPDEMQSIWKSVGCLILPSSFDPWPLTLVEACAAGLPVICTHKVGSQVEVVKMYWNGLVINDKDSSELTNSLVWAHRNRDTLPEMGKRSLVQAEPYSAKVWAKKILSLLNNFN